MRPARMKECFSFAAHNFFFPFPLRPQPSTCNKDVQFLCISESRKFRSAVNFDYIYSKKIIREKNNVTGYPGMYIAYPDISIVIFSLPEMVNKVEYILLN